MKFGRSPGTDGLPVEFYAILLGEDSNDEEAADGVLCRWLRAVFNHAFHRDVLPTTMREIQIRLLFKKSTVVERRNPANYRPISLLNVDYKILSKLLALAMSPAIGTIISQSQFCGKGRDIGDLIHLIQSVTQFMNDSDRAGFMLLLDFAKAFDSVNHQFTEEALHAVGLPRRFVRWAMLAFKQTKAAIIVNGKLSRNVAIEGGGRQGDHLYPLIFSVVMEVFRATVLGEDTIHGIDGIKVPADGAAHPGVGPFVDASQYHRAVIGQYMDDSTLFGEGERDMGTFLSAIRRFCAASGMTVNWDKSMLVFLGSLRDAPLTHGAFASREAQQLKTLQPGAKVRILGSDMGHYEDKHEAWRKLKGALQRSVDSKIRSTGDRVGNVLTANACLGGIAAFIVNFQQLTPAECLEADRIMLRFIRGSSHTIRDANYSASRSDGNVVPFQRTADRVTSLVARWPHKFLSTAAKPVLPAYAGPWSRELHALAVHGGYACFDHLMLDNRDHRRADGGTHRFQSFTNVAIQAFRRLGYGRVISDAWEDVADMPLANNTHIIHPQSGEPWRETGNMLGGRGRRPKYLYHLLEGFDVSRYHNDNAEVHPMALSEPDRLWRRYPGTSIEGWRRLLAAIPQHFLRILTAGNLNNRPDGALFQESGPDPMVFPRIYQWDGRQLQLLTAHGGPPGYTAFRRRVGPTGLPGELVNEGPHGLRFPLFEQLRRVRHVVEPRHVDNVAPEPDLYRVAGLMLPDYKDWRPFDYGVLVRQYEHPDSMSLRKVTKQWRAAQVARPPEVTQFATTVFGDPEYDLTCLTRTIGTAIVPAKMRTMVWKLIHGGLYVGAVAHHYQRRVKGLEPTDPRLTPRRCPYAAYAWSPNFRPSRRKINGDFESTYDYIFWSGPLARYVWGDIRRHLQAMDIYPFQQEMQCWTDVIKYLDGLPRADLESGSPVPHIVAATLVAGLWTLYANYKKLTDRAQESYSSDDPVVQFSDTEIDCWPLELQRSLHRNLATIGRCLPVMYSEAKKRECVQLGEGRRRRIYTERQRALFAPCLVRPQLDRATVDLFETYWAKTSVIDIVQNTVHIQAFTFHDYPP